MPEPRTVANHAASGSFEARALVALERLGYRIATAGSSTDPIRDANLRIVDEERLAEISGNEPILVLRARPSPGSTDRRVVEAVVRPATLVDLYAALQRALETTPRLAPRIVTRLPARCWQDGRSWSGDVVSLSETGCLLGTRRQLEGSSGFELAFHLPSGDTVSTPVRAVRRSGLNTGFAFEGLSKRPRVAIAQYVIGRLTA